MGTAVRTALINIVVFFVLVVLIEALVRWLHPEITPQNLDQELFDPYKYGRTYGYKSLATGEEFGAVYVTDEHGFRTRSNSSHPKTSGQGILLGDSVSVGVGVDVEQTYASLLEDKLGKKVLNASVTGYALVDYVRVIAAVANTLKPEFVMIGVCLNDVASSSQENIVAMLQKKKRYPNQLVRWLRYFNDNYFNFNDLLKTYSRTYLFAKSLASDTARNYFVADRLYYENPETVELLSSQFSELQGLLPQGTALVLFIFPYEYQLRARSFETLQPQRIIKEAGGRAGVLIHDLYDELEEYLKINQLSPKSLYLFDDPMHFSSLGHQAIAGIVYRHVKGLPVRTLKQTSSDHLLSISPIPT